MRSTNRPEARAPGVPAEKIRVLFVNTAKHPPLGAGPWVHTQIMRHLDRSRYELYAACVTGPRDAPAPMFQILNQIPDIHLHPVDFGPEGFGESLRGSLTGKVEAVLETGRAIGSLAGLALFVRRHRVQIIHTDERPRDALACVLLSRLTGAKCIIHMHVNYGEWMSPLLKWSLKRADAIIAVSEFVERSLVSSGHESSRILLVPNGIDPADWEPGAGREEVRREFRIPADAPVIITVCRLMPGKGPDDLIRSLPLIRLDFLDVRLLIVGGDVGIAVGFRQQLVALTDELGVAGNVIITGRRGDVSRLMAAADIYAMPSVGEPFGLVFLEAMAMKLPVVALASGGAPEVVEHGTTGLLSEVGDFEGLVQHLLTLIRDPVLRTAMGAQGQRRFQACFTAPRMASDTAGVYRWLMSQTRRPMRRSRHGHLGGDRKSAPRDQ